MSTRKFEPEKLGDTLAVLMKRYRRVDVSAIETVRERWTQLVGSSLAEMCVPEVVKDGVLYVRVPSGAYSQKLQMDAEKIITALEDIGPSAPHSLHVTVRG
jgi:predicted nucleic acid-binding Zn ribbon protein